MTSSTINIEFNDEAKAEGVKTLDQLTGRTRMMIISCETSIDKIR